MTWLSIALAGIGVGDIVRSTSWRPGRVVGHVAAPVVILALALLAGMHGWADLLALVLAAAAGAGVGRAVPAHPDDRPRTRSRRSPSSPPSSSVCSPSPERRHPRAEPLATWLGWADLPGHGPLPAARVLLLTGLVLFNVATANIIVRLVLLTIGALRPSDVTDANAAAAAAASLAGRAAPPTAGSPPTGSRAAGCSGPMERLVILGLGVAGEFGAAGLVIAAKGLLRFPEIQAAARSANGDPAPRPTAPTPAAPPASTTSPSTSSSAASSAGSSPSAPSPSPSEKATRDGPRDRRHAARRRHTPSVAGEHAHPSRRRRTHW